MNGKTQEEHRLESVLKRRILQIADEEWNREEEEGYATNYPRLSDRLRVCGEGLLNSFNADTGCPMPRGGCAD